MSRKLQSVRGMNDVLPAESRGWRELESRILNVLDAYGYEEIRLPLLEASEVFQRAIGDATDIVQKEMYTFADRNGDSLTLRPEGTAGCVRAVLQHGLLQQLPQRLWYRGPMFRHERPQRGRLRQFHQIGCEVFGPPGPDVDAELIVMTARMWRALELGPVRLEINTLGTSEARAAYRDVLTQYFEAHRDALDDDSRDRLTRNPLRILDSKNPDMRELVAGAPSLLEHLDEPSQAHFDTLRGLLDAAGIAYDVNPRLVRGLDYYSRTVFEWITEELGAQGTVCAGGRYDGLVELAGGRPTPAVGFAMGLERLLELSAAAARATAAPELYVCATDDALDGAAALLAESLRDRFPAWAVIGHAGGGSLKSRMKKADRSGARVALILGPEEHARGAVTVRPLRTDTPQTVADTGTLDTALPALLGS